jgi:hypothetical protein
LASTSLSTQSRQSRKLTGKTKLLGIEKYLMDFAGFATAETQSARHLMKW